MAPKSNPRCTFMTKDGRETRGSILVLACVPFRKNAVHVDFFNPSLDVPKKATVKVETNIPRV